MTGVRDYWAAGGTTFPVDAVVTAETLFATFDPQTDMLISLFRSAICAELGGGVSTVDSTSPWAAARQGTALATMLPVADTLYMAPTKAVLTETRMLFPLLAVYRTECKFEEHTLEEDNLNWTWGIDYLLGPLRLEDRRRLIGALSGVAKIITRIVRRRSHPAYQGGATLFAGEAANPTLGEWQLVQASVGPASFGDDGDGVEYLGVHLELLATERSHERDDIDPELQGVTYNFGLGGTEGVVPGIVGARGP